MASLSSSSSSSSSLSPLFFLLLLSLSLVVAQVTSSCPNSCSGHGTCSPAMQCMCDAGWGGTDCSMSDALLVSGTSQHGIVGTREWRYYHISTTSSHSSLVIEVNQTSLTGDCDTYVRFGTYPTRVLYDYRDISSSKNSRIVVTNPQMTSAYYIGIYGFLGAEYDIRATVASSCPNDCSGHGTCNTLGATCRCFDGYAGTDCSTPIFTMRNNTPYTGSVTLRQWTYYTFRNTYNTLTVTMNQTGSDPGQDCDLYVKLGAVPNLTFFDYRDTTMSSFVQLKVSEAVVGDYDIGVYGFKACSYVLTAVSTNECPNRCSGSSHGTCSSATSCSCTSRFSGTACETMVSALGYDAPITGYVGANFWNYYHFRPYSSNNINISLHQDTSTMDCDLYVKRNANPSRFDFDYRDISFNQDISIVIETPDSVDYYIGAFGYKDCAYTLSLAISRFCPNSCTNPSQGSCVNGHCLCYTGWTGDDCSVPSNALTIGTTTIGTVLGGQWSFYSLSVRAGYEVTVVMREGSSTGYLWLFGSRDAFPSMGSYDFADMESNTPVHHISFTPPFPMNVQIGVFASPLSLGGMAYDYKIVAWQASFSSSSPREVLIEQVNP